MSWIYLIMGVALLYVGGEFLVAHASDLARRLGVSPLVVGLTVVAFGTSAPELASSIEAVLQDAHGVAFGNAVGSNIANIGLVLGLAALITPVATGARFLRREVPFMIIVCALPIPMALNHRLDRWEGVILLAVILLYLFYLLKHKGASSQENDVVPSADVEQGHPIWYIFGGIVMGLALLVGGAKALVTGAVDIARTIGVSERVIGLTVVACGTSLPELAASVVAAIKKESDILLGNVVGSNIFNILLILGATAVVEPIRLVAEGIWIDLGVMVGFSMIVLLFLYTGLRVVRLEGAILVAGYGAYVSYLFITG